MNKTLIAILSATVLVFSAQSVYADDEGMQYMQRYADAFAKMQEKESAKISCDRSRLKSRNENVGPASDCYLIKTAQEVGEHQNYHWERNLRVLKYNNNSYLAVHTALKAAGAYSWPFVAHNHNALKQFGFDVSSEVNTMSNGKKLKVSMFGKYATGEGKASNGKFQCLLAYSKRGQTSVMAVISCAKDVLPTRDDMKVVLKAIQ